MNQFLKLLIIIFITVSVTLTFGQETGQIGVAIYGNYSQPLAGLSDWFKPATNILAAVGSQNDPDWYYAGELEYTEFSKENLSGYPAGRLSLNLEHIGILFNARYRFISEGMLKPYLSFAVGPFYWKGTRGAIAEDSTRNIPFIDRKTLEEWNWGFKAGAGLEMRLLHGVHIDLLINYRFIVGDLWPTLQQYIELDGVSGFQTLNFTLGIKYYFD
jgi:hypothetical protein